MSADTDLRDALAQKLANMEDDLVLTFPGGVQFIKWSVVADEVLKVIKDWTAEEPSKVSDIDAANSIYQIVLADAASYLERERAGSSASMNGALDYTGPRIIERLKQLGWRPA